jgi:hypothetical protein
MARKLIDLEVEEVSLVDAAANRTKFAIIKRRVIMDELTALLKALLGEEVTDAELAKAKELPEDAMKAIKGALNILNKYKDEFPAEILSAIKSLAKFSSYGYPEKKTEELSKEDVEKVGARLSKATLEELKKISTALDGVDLKAIKKIREIVDGLIKDASILDKKLYDGLPEDVRARLIKLDADEAEAQKKVQETTQTEVVKAAIVEAIKPLQAEIAELKKTKGITKSVKGQEGGDKGEEDKSGFWPSLKQT